MKCQQICNLQLETRLGQVQLLSDEVLDPVQAGMRDNENDNIKYKLQRILECLEQQKNEFISAHHQQRSLLIQKIHFEKDQIIQGLLKNIHNLKKQNQQLKFQYRKRFKVIKNIENKYQELILVKNKKITEYQSVLKYLENKIKFLQKKLENYQTQSQKQQKQKNKHHLSKSPRNHLSPKKISLIASKQIRKINQNKRTNFRNYLQQFTLPLTNSFFSLNKGSSSNTTKIRIGSNPNFKEDRILQKIEDPKQSDIYSSFLASTQQNSKENQIDYQAHFEGESFIAPNLSQNYFSIAKEYLTQQDLNDLQDNQFKIVKPPMKRSQQVSNSLQGKKRINIFKQKF